MNKTKPRVAIYCRLSQEDKNKKNKEDDSESIKNQKKLLMEYAIDQDWEIQGIYFDDDWEGMNNEGPDYNKVLKLAEQGKIDIVLCKHQSRFTRDSTIVGDYILEKFKEWNVRFVSLLDNIDTSAKGHRKSSQINGLMNEWYIADMSDNIKTSLTLKRKDGEYIGSVPLYGYKKDESQKGHLVIDPVAAEVVKEIFLLYNKGYGKTAIARELNNRGIPNRTQYKKEQGITYKTPSSELGTLWKYSAIDDILHDEMYIGNMVQGKYGSISFKTKKNKPKPKEEWIIVEGTHEPIIDMDLWNSVQDKINANFKPFSGGKIGTFAQKCKCKYCGYILKSSKSHDDRYLRCPTRQVDKSSCDGSFISENLLKRVVLKELNSLIEQYLNVDQLEEKIILKQFRNEKEQLKKELSQYQANITKQSNTIKALYIDKVNGIITEEQFVEFNTEFNKQKDNLELVIAEKNKKLTELENEQETLKSKRELLQKYVNVTELTREMVDNLIDYIEVGAKDPTTKKKTIEIH